eukprot:ANDGO_07026.mRNA.1 hypothetical protein
MSEEFQEGDLVSFVLFVVIVVGIWYVRQHFQNRSRPSSFAAQSQLQPQYHSQSQSQPQKQPVQSMPFKMPVSKVTRVTSSSSSAAATATSGAIAGGSAQSAASSGKSVPSYVTTPSGKRITVVGKPIIRPSAIPSSYSIHSSSSGHATHPVNTNTNTCALANNRLSNNSGNLTRKRVQQQQQPSSPWVEQSTIIAESSMDMSIIR